jgi:formamidopyrimidine-DNA glycosylase
MPELPEVEVTKRGMAAKITGQVITSVTIRNHHLRWPIPADLARRLKGATVQTVARRGKFILIDCLKKETHGTLIVHLGMTGTFRVVERSEKLRTHDHVDLVFGDMIARFNDPRRFGAVLWHDPGKDGPIESNRHLKQLGVEPFGPDFEGDLGGDLLFRESRGRTVAIKQLLLSGAVVVGVGNIYCSESLFRAGINPKVSAGRVSRPRYRRLAESIRRTLDLAIKAGGSTLRDFVGSDGALGYFQQEYFVYGRAGLDCRVCGSTIKQLRQGQRSTFYCPRCQAR